MRASTAVGLLLVSSASIFGMFGRHRANSSLPPGPEPVYVNGVMGVYNPDTGAFVPSTSPLFDETCDLIQRRREEANGYYSNASQIYPHHYWHYYSGGNYFMYPSPGSEWTRAWGAASGSGFGSRSSGGFGSEASHSGSIRGGIGGTGHGFGASHS